MKLNDKVTTENIDEAIRSVAYHVLPGTTLTVCLLELYSGFTVTGESACCNPANFDRALGERYALEAAKEKLWPLLGFLLAHQNWERNQ